MAIFIRIQIPLYLTASIQVVGKGSAKPITRDGVEYLQADKIITKLRVGNAQIAVEDANAGIAGKSKTQLNDRNEIL